MQHEINMNSRELVYAALNGKKSERLPVATPYVMLVQADHWSELTGLPAWKYFEWLIQSPEEHAKMYPILSANLAYDILQPTQWRPGKDTQAYRENTEVVLKDGHAYYHHKKEHTYELLNLNIHESNESPMENQIVFNNKDVLEKVLVEKAETMIANGCIDREKAMVAIMKDQRFIVTGGILNTFYYCSWYVGLTNLFVMLIEEPELIEYLSQRLLEKNIERIRMLA